MSGHLTVPPGTETLDAALASHAASRPEQVAVVCEGNQYTYAQLDRESSSSGSAMLASGLGPGSRVAFLGRETEVYYEILFACAKVGAVLVPINWRLAADEVRFILQDSDAALLFAEENLLPGLRPSLGELAELRSVILVEGAGPDGRCFAEWKAAEGAAPLPEHRSLADDPVAQLYTSGTTGLPKGVVLAHRSFFAVRRLLDSSGLDWINWQPDDRSLIGIPGSHVGGLWWATQGFNAGVTNVAVRSFSGKDVLELIRTVGVTTACMVPAMLSMLLAEPGATSAGFATLRKVVYGGSPIAESLLQHCIDVMKCDFAQIYGLTETGNTAVCLPPADHVPGSPRLRAAGRPYPGVDLKIIDRSGQRLADGEVGEVCIRTPARMLEYWRRADATAETLVEGWIHTGDAGRLDENGYLFIQDRIKEMIIRAGENIYPAEVENAISAHPKVHDVAVIGVPDERWGEAVHAFVALRSGAVVGPREIRTFLRGRLADFKVPTRYEFVDKVPRNPSGKILRRTLRDRFWNDRDRSVN